jgi:hypothetical protein
MLQHKTILSLTSNRKTALHPQVKGRRKTNRCTSVLETIPIMETAPVCFIESAV